MKQVNHFGIDTGILRHQFAVFFGLGRKQAVGFDRGTFECDDNFRVFKRIFGICQSAVESSRIGLRAIVNLTCITAVRKQLGKGYKVGVGGDLVGLQCRPGNFRRLGDDGDVLFRIPALRLHGAQQQTVRGGGERHGNGLAFQIRQRLHRGRLGDHDAVAAANGAAG